MNLIGLLGFMENSSIQNTSSYRKVLHVLNNLTLIAVVLYINLFIVLSASADQGLAIGVPEFENQIDWLVSKQPVAAYVRKGILRTLVSRSNDSKHVRLDIASSLNVSADYKTWTLRLGQHRYTSGENILGSDVIFSLELCSKHLQQATLKSSKLESKISAIGVVEEWITLDFENAKSNASNLAELAEQSALFLAECPILSQKASSRFSNQLGIGTNIVSGGFYFIADYKSGREIVLARSSFALSSKLNKAPPRISLRAFKDSVTALEALRVGTIDAFITKDKLVLDKVAKDETLLSQPCADYSKVYRRGLEIGCPDSFNPLDSGYAT